MGGTPSPVMLIAGAATDVQQSRQIARSRLHHWLPLIFFTVLIGAQTVARTGDFAGAVDSTKPARSLSQTFTTADGYVLFWDGIPINGDARSFLALTRFLQGQQEPTDTGIYDRRAGYAYVGALASLPLGHYRSFIALNAVAWLGAALAMYWLGGRLLGSRLAAWLAGTLTATGQGFSFMVGTPISTLLGFASVAMVLAFVEWAGLLRPPLRWREWLHTSWLIATISLLYPIYLGLLAFIWIHELRRTPLMGLLGLSAVALILAQAWPVLGTAVVGLEFDTANSALLAAALNGWWSLILGGTTALLNVLRFVAIAGTIYAAFPGLLLLASMLGYVLTSQSVRQWALSLCLAALMSSLLFTLLYAVPRTAFFAYPAIYLLAAAGLAHVAHVIHQFCKNRWGLRWCRPGARMTVQRLSTIALPATIVIMSLLLLVGPNLAALVGYSNFDVSFHFWTPAWDIGPNE